MVTEERADEARTLPATLREWPQGWPAPDVSKGSGAGNA